MFGLFVTALTLGIAGIDPAGLLVALASLTAGARERTVLIFTAIVVACTALLGTLITLTLGQQLQDFDWTSLLPPDWLGATLEALLAAALLVWAVVRVRRPGVRPPKPAKPGRTGAALVGAGLVFAASAPLDPTFLGLVVLAGRSESVPAIGLAHVTWIVVSQLPSLLLPPPSCSVDTSAWSHGSAISFLGLARSRSSGDLDTRAWGTRHGDGRRLVARDGALPIARPHLRLHADVEDTLAPAAEPMAAQRFAHVA